MITSLADTQPAIDYLRSDNPTTNPLALLIRRRELAISVVTLAELRDGVLGSRNPATSEADLARFLRGLDVIGADEDTAAIFAGIRYRLRRQGQSIPEHDIWIASTALQYDLALISKNGHFDRIPELKRGS